jgi:hypothetical protein
LRRRRSGRAGFARASVCNDRSTRPNLSRASKTAAVAGALALAGIWLAYDYLYGRGGDRPVDWQDVTSAVPSARFPRPTERVLETREELLAVVPRAPPIDLSARRAVLVASGPRSSSGYALEVESVREERRRVVVTVRERSPSLGDRVQPRLTYPFRLITLPRGDKPVEVAR